MHPRVWNLLLVQHGIYGESHNFTKRSACAPGNGYPAAFFCVWLHPLSNAVYELYNSIHYFPQIWCVFHTVTQAISYRRLILYCWYSKPLSISECGERSVKGLLLSVNKRRIKLDSKRGAIPWQQEKQSTWKKDRTPLLLRGVQGLVLMPTPLDPSPGDFLHQWEKIL